jgi:hypothetical protein
LIGLLFLADAYLPKAPSREYREVDKTIIRIYSQAKVPG